MTTGSAIETRYLKFLAEEMVKVNLKIVALSDWLRNKNPHDKDLTRILLNFPCSAVFVPQLLTDTGIWTADPDPLAAGCKCNCRDKPQEHKADSEAGDINENCDGGSDKESSYDQESSSQSDSESDSSTSLSDSKSMEQRLVNLRLAKGPQLARRSIPFPKKPKDVQKKNCGSGQALLLPGPNTDPSPKCTNKRIEQQQDELLERCGKADTLSSGLPVTRRNFSAPSGEQPQEYGTNFDVRNESDENLYERNFMDSLSGSMSSYGSQYSWSSSSNSDEKKDIKLTIPDMEHNTNAGDLKLDKVKKENSGEHSARTLKENHVRTEKESEEADPETGPNISQKQVIRGSKTPSDRTAGLEPRMKPCNVKLTRVTEEFINSHNQPRTSGVKRKRKKNILNRKCRYCFKEFTRHADLLRHELIHTGQKPFPCKVCGMFFRQKAHLVSHHRIHTGEKPFACKRCGKCFREKRHLENHLLVHTGQKPFSCKVCGMSFRLKAHLVRHLRIHTGEKPFACKSCEKSFRQKTSLENHILIVHTEEEMPFVPEILTITLR